MRTAVDPAAWRQVAETGRDTPGIERGQPLDVPPRGGPVQVGPVRLIA